MILSFWTGRAGPGAGQTVQTQNLRSSLIRVDSVFLFHLHYRNDQKFSDKQVWAKSADRVQNAPKGAV